MSNKKGGQLRELALFAGVGGGLLATTHLLRWRTVAAVEINPYRREVLLRRQRDGLLDVFPIWDDIRTFDGRQFRGSVDVVTAGFPCQPHSTAARGRNGQDKLWSHVVRIVREVSPRFVFAENVVGAGRFMPVVRDDLLRMGYCVRQLAKIGASCLGAPHIRDRLWVLADSNAHGEPIGSKHAEVAQLKASSTINWWGKPPNMVGVVDEFPNRVDRLGAIGDGQVPAVVALAWNVLSGGDNA